MCACADALASLSFKWAHIMPILVCDKNIQSFKACVCGKSLCNILITKLLFSKHYNHIVLTVDNVVLTIENNFLCKSVMLCSYFEKWALYLKLGVSTKFIYAGNYLSYMLF